MAGVTEATLNMIDLGDFMARERGSAAKITPSRYKPWYPNMGLLETPGQSDTSFSSMAESSFISSSMGNHFGVFERLDFVLAAFFLGFM
jgi:hypothetical protein